METVSSVAKPQSQNMPGHINSDPWRKANAIYIQVKQYSTVTKQNSESAVKIPARPAESELSDTGR